MSEIGDSQSTMTGQLPPKKVEVDDIETTVTSLLRALGQDDKDEVMKSTPRRVAELYAEIINPGGIDIDYEFKIFDNPGVTDMIIVNDVHYVSLCEHHLAPAFGIAHLAYVPDQSIVGYSKLKKGLNYLARQPQLNERLVVETLDFVEARVAPLGIGLILRSAHSCMALKANAPGQEVVTVSDFRGVLKEDRFRLPFWSSAMAERPSFLGR